jgi:RNA polymerase sigma-70 factor (ECF subfamily)
MSGHRPLNAEERALLDRLVRSVGPALLAYARRMCRREEEAEDVVAETFLRAAGNVASLRRCERADLYLLTIARNLCRDRARRTRAQPSAEQTAANRAVAGPYPLPTADPAAAAESREEAAALRAAVDDLPETYREIVALRFVLGLKFEEIAVLLEVPLGTALFRGHEALRRLRKRLLTGEARRRTTQAEDREPSASRRPSGPGCPQPG